MIHFHKTVLFAIYLVVIGTMAPAQDAAFDQTGRRLFAIETMLADGQTRRAEAILTRLIRTASTAQSSARYADLLRQVYVNQPFQLRGNVRLLPSTNVTRAATAKTFSTLLGDFDIVNGGETPSGLGINARVGLGYRMPAGPNQTLQINAAVARTYYDHEDLRYWSGNVGADFVHRLPNRTLRYGVSVKRTVYDTAASTTVVSPDAWTYAITSSLSQDRNMTTRTVSGRLEYRDFIEQDARDGPFAQAQIFWAMPVGDRGHLRWGAGLQRHLPALDYQRNWAAFGQVSYAHSVSDTMQLGATVSGTVRRYDSDFATVDFARADDIYQVQFSVSDTRIKIAGAVPTVSCGYTAQQSNIALYETSYTDCAVTFSFDF